MRKLLIPHIFTLIPESQRARAAILFREYPDIKKVYKHEKADPTIVEPALSLSKTAATYSPTVTQYHRRDEA